MTRIGKEVFIFTVCTTTVLFLSVLYTINLKQNRISKDMAVVAQSTDQKKEEDSSGFKHNPSSGSAAKTFSTLRRKQPEYIIEESSSATSPLGRLLSNDNSIMAIEELNEAMIKTQIEPIAVASFLADALDNAPNRKLS